MPEMQIRTLATRLASALVVLAFLSIDAPAQDATAYTFQADGLACPFCAYSIEKQVKRIPGVETINIDIKKGTVTVTMAAGATLDEAVALKAVEAAGFSFRDFEHVRK